VQKRLIVEGNTLVLVPRLDPKAPYPPSSASVFYNPKMEVSRDINVACMQVLASEQRGERPLTYLDALGGSGVRGLRVANEARLKVTLNDLNPLAYRLMRTNKKRLGLDVDIRHLDANVLLSETTFSVVDIDSFGSPMPFVDSACRSVCKMLCVTATDTAPLSGVHFNAGVRRYSALPANTEYHAETGIRILIGKIAREFAKYDKSIKPVLAHATAHYYRVYLLIDQGATLADECIASLGYIVHCEKCGHRSILGGLAPLGAQDCQLCHAKLIVAGPLWLGVLHVPQFCERMLERIETGVFGTRKQSAKIIELCANELDIVTFFDYHRLLRELKRPPMPMEELINGLRTSGYRASRTHFSGTSFKTDANVDTIKQILLQLSNEMKRENAASNRH